MQSPYKLYIRLPHRALELQAEIADAHLYPPGYLLQVYVALGVVLLYVLLRLVDIHREPALPLYVDGILKFTIYVLLYACWSVMFRPEAYQLFCGAAKPITKKLKRKKNKK